MRRYVIGGNWKLKINTVAEATEVIQKIITKFSLLKKSKNVDVFIGVPYPLLVLARDLLQESSVSLAAQNVHSQEVGAFTGAVSVLSLKDLSVEYVIVGHSERRLIFNETNEEINEKLKLVIKHDMTPVFCIGETAADRAADKVQPVLSTQLSEGLAGIDSAQAEDIIIAYEPVWAINNPLLNPDAEIKAATPEEAAATHDYIRSWLTEHYGSEIADGIRLQYGGSMKPANAEELLSITNIDGGLVGSASLDADSFIPIIEKALSQ